MAKRRHMVTIRHRASGRVVAEGPVGWGVTPFESAWYVSPKYRLDGRFRPSPVPGICPYKGLYQWLDFELNDEIVVDRLGWYYWLPNPLLPFTAFRVALPASHPDLEYEKVPLSL